MKKIILLISFVFLVSFVFAGEIGDSCSYYANGDSQCNTENNIYCLEFTCDFVSDPNNWCIDSDSNNLASSGETYARNREYNGIWINLSNEDECLNDNMFVSSCTASLCKIREATCIGTERVFETHECENCDNGACLSYSPPSITGNPCNYELNLDSECDTENGIYCVNNYCTEVTDTNIYCNDSDANNLNTKGTVETRSRQYNGEWIENNLNDGCKFGTSPVYSCNGTECIIQELTCSGTESQYADFPCGSCIDGACINFDSNNLGQACNYYDFKDTQCSPDQNIFCLGNKCSYNENINSYCIDSDDENYFSRGTIRFSYRNLVDGNIISSIGYDYCLDSVQLVEFKCMLNWPEINYTPHIISCENGCYDGKCIKGTENTETSHCVNGIMDFNETGIDCGGGCQTCSNDFIPENVSDHELLAYISQWVKKIINDEQINQAIKAWKKKLS